MTRAGNVLAAYLGALGVVSLLATGCSSDEAAPETTIVEPNTVDTTSPATTDPPTTDPTTTAAPTTTIDPAAALAAKVEADFLEADRLGREASMDPFDAEKEGAALDRRLGLVRDKLAAKLSDWRARNYALRENPDIPASITFEVPATLVLQGADVVEFQICEVNSWLVVEVGAGPNGGDAVVDPDVSASRATVLMREVGGVWKFEGGNQIAVWDGVTECPPE